MIKSADIGAVLCEALGLGKFEVEKLTIVLEDGQPARLTVQTVADQAMLRRFTEEVEKLGLMIDQQDVLSLQDIGREFVLLRKEAIGEEDDEDG